MKNKYNINQKKMILQKKDKNKSVYYIPLSLNIFWEDEKTQKYVSMYENILKDFIKEKHPRVNTKIDFKLNTSLNPKYDMVVCCEVENV